MSSMADPMVALLQLQQALNDGHSFDSISLGDGYVAIPDIRSEDWQRYGYAKIQDGIALALSIFYLEEPFNGVTCYNVGYAVNEEHRGKGLSIDVINKGLEDLKRRLSSTVTDRFYLEAIVGITNHPSIQVAQKLFASAGQRTVDRDSGEQALHFNKLIILRNR